MKLVQGTPHKKYSEALETMLWNSIDYFFGYFNLKVHFIATDKIPTAGVTIKNLTLLHYYNPAFLDSLTQEQAKFLLLHETYHFLFNHQSRTQRATHDKQLANIAQDMIINELILEHHEEIEFIEGGLRMDKSYKGKWIYEELYNWLLKNRTKIYKPGKGAGEGLPTGSKGGGKKKEKEKEPGQGIPNSTASDGRLATIADLLPLDDHLEMSEADAEILDTLVEGAIETHRTTNSRGNSPAFQALFDRIRPKKGKDNLRELKRSIAHVKGSMVKRTYRREHRKGFEGVKGKLKFNKNINAILDISGSVDDQRFKVLFSELFRDGYQINLIPCTTEITLDQPILIRSKAELAKKYQRNESGGTEMQVGIDYIIERPSIANLPTVLLTDGFTDELDASRLKQLLVISTDVEAPIGKGKHKTKQIILPAL